MSVVPDFNVVGYVTPLSTILLGITKVSDAPVYAEITALPSVIVYVSSAAVASVSSLGWAFTLNTNDSFDIAVPFGVIIIVTTWVSAVASVDVSYFDIYCISFFVIVRFALVEVCSTFTFTGNPE